MPALEYVENTVVVCELTLAGVGVEVLVLTEGETEIEVDFDLLFDVAVETPVILKLNNFRCHRNMSLKLILSVCSHLKRLKEPH